MKGRAYKTALKKVGLSIRKAGPFLGFTSRQSTRIAGGEAELPEAARKLLALMVVAPIAASDLDDFIDQKLTITVQERPTLRL